MSTKRPIGIDVLIDKLTRCIENVLTGERFQTEISLITREDLSGITKKSGWNFNWKNEFAIPQRDVFKLYTMHNQAIVQGLLSLEVLSSSGRKRSIQCGIAQGICWRCRQPHGLCL